MPPQRRLMHPDCGFLWDFDLKGAGYSPMDAAADLGTARSVETSEFGRLVNEVIDKTIEDETVRQNQEIAGQDFHAATITAGRLQVLRHIREVGFGFEYLIASQQDHLE